MEFIRNLDVKTSDVLIFLNSVKDIDIFCLFVRIPDMNKTISFLNYHKLLDN